MKKRPLTVRERVFALLDTHRSMDVQAIRAALPDVKPDTIGYALWELVRSGDVARTPGGPPRPGVPYIYSITLEDDGWQPQQWRHPYASGVVAR